MSYYNKYWQKKLKAKSQYLPPNWTDNQFNYIYKNLFFYLGENILDIGCGQGEFLSLLNKRRKNKKLTGIDISSVAISKAKHNFKNIKFYKSSSSKTPFANNSFDTILLIEVIEHLVDTDSTLQEIKRILKPDGYLMITTTDFNLLKKILISTFVWDKYFYPNNPHIRFFTKKTLKDLCQNHHFSPIKHLWNGHYFHIMPKGQIAIFQNKKNVK